MDEFQLYILQSKIFNCGHFLIETWRSMERELEVEKGPGSCDMTYSGLSHMHQPTWKEKTDLSLTHL